MCRTIFVMLTAATIAATSPTASAQPAVEKFSVKVFYGDLDLAKPAGKQTLHRRIERASNQACGSSDPMLLEFSGKHRRCVDDAMAKALDDIAGLRTENQVAAETVGTSGR